MKKIFGILVLGFAAQAFATGNILVRADYQNVTSKTGAVDNSYSNMAPQNILLTTMGKLGEAEFKFSLNFNSSVSATGGNAVAWPDIFDEAWVGKGIGTWKFMAGKMFLLAGGYEGSYITNGQTYLKSLANFGGLVVTPGNLFGIHSEYDFSDQKLSFQVLNAPSYSPTNKTRRQSIGALYNGAFFSKKLNLSLGQTAFANDTANGAATLSASNFSIQYLITETLSIDAEQILNSNKTDLSGAKADATTSFISEIKYKIGKYTPIFKFESSEDKSQENVSLAASKKRTTYGLAVEIAPTEKDNFHYFVGYKSLNDKPGTGSETNESMVFAGLTFNGELWK